MQNYFQDKTVLVTGAAGLVGSHLVEHLLEVNAKVIGVDNYISSTGDNLKEFENNERFTFIKANATDPPENYLPKDVFIDVIYHFASPASPPIYQAYPVETYLVNTVGTHNLLSWLKKHNSDGRFLMASTSEVYGSPEVHPQPETYWGNVNPNGKRSCYDEAKRMSETICGVFNRDFGMDTRIVRIFNTYGPKNSLEDGRIIPQFIKQYLAKEKLTVYGDGSQTRSYCYIDDLIAGLLTYGAKDDLNGETINLGNPGEFTILETAYVFNELMGRELDYIEFLTLPSDDPTQRKPDITKAQTLLGWEPKIDFKTGLKKTVEYYEKLAKEKEIDG
ncbi:MAG: GDP-mannose 4,6-dehydratase [Pseudomonadales bacterium]|jgi:nucleoside-diphosphate-sugar epimerase|nr:GDP-mannose 4,6-dehydratase [Pseudomonadales bacterium]